MTTLYVTAPQEKADAEHTEVGSGRKHHDRPQLMTALKDQLRLLTNSPE